MGFTVARQSRFATIKDRYLYRMGAANPNPDLKAESALHPEAAYSDKYSRHLTDQANIFYSCLTDVIQQVNNV